MHLKTKIMNRFIVAVLASASIAPIGFALDATKDGLTVSGELEVVSDSNIESTSTELDDTIVRVTPEVIYRHRKGVVGLEAGTGVKIIRYDEYSDNDNENFFAYANLSGMNREDSPLDGNINLEYRERTEANDILQDIANSENFTAGMDFKYLVSQKFKFGFDSDYNVTEYDNVSFAQIETKSIGGTVNYVYSPKLDLGAGVRFSKNETEGGPTATIELDAEDTAYFLTVEGELTGKITSEIEVGIATREFNTAKGLADSTRTYANASLFWAVQDRTTVNLKILSGFGASPSNQSRHYTGATISINHNLTEIYGLRALIGYRHQIFTGETASLSRTDDNVMGEIGATASYTDWMDVDFAVRMEDNDSTLTLTSYERLTATLAIKVAY